MDGFKKIVLIIAIIILILILIFIGVGLSKQQKTKAWPPFVAQCPDYWTIDENNICHNVQNLGNVQQASCKVLDTTLSAYTGSNANCNRYTYANNCNISWDGINYGVNNPCG